jgi:hypothetical protein
MARPRVGARTRRAVEERARDCCEYCRSQSRFATHAFSLEHILPQSRGGKTTLDNLALSCQGCNNHKYTSTEGRDPVTKEPASLFHPRRQRWRDHFTWSPDYVYIIGITPTGRATVELLQLNRERLLNMRRVLHGAGEHPPEE